MKKQINIPKDMRPIAILPTLLKLYCAACCAYCKARCVISASGNLHSALGGNVTTLSSYSGRSLKNMEWKQPVSIADGDLPKVYDNVRYSLACRRLVDKGFPEIIVAATIRKANR